MSILFGLEDDPSEIEPSTLWLFDKRDNSTGQTGWYHGNTPTQVVTQCLLRCTKPGEVVVDPFFGSGTTGFDALRRGRKVIGVELQRELAEKVAHQLQDAYPDRSDDWRLFVGDCASETVFHQVKEQLDYWNQSPALIFMHPPYHDMVRFSDDPNCLSNAGSLESFLDRWQSVSARWLSLLPKGKWMAVVMGDMYRNGEWIPLGFLTMQRVLDTGLAKLHAVVCKNIADQRSLRRKEALWRSLAQKQSLFIFGHEYVFFFKRQ